VKTSLQRIPLIAALGGKKSRSYLAFSELTFSALANSKCVKLARLATHNLAFGEMPTFHFSGNTPMESYFFKA
jgi:hypothetical protein